MQRSVDQLRIVILGSDAKHRGALAQQCAELGWTDVRTFDYGKDALKHFEVTSANVLIALSDIGDMHWSTFIRALHTDKTLYHVPVVFVFDRRTPDDRHHVGTLASYGVDAVLDLPVDAALLGGHVRRIVASEQNVQSYQFRLAKAKVAYKEGLIAMAKALFKDLVDENGKNLTARAGLLYSSADDTAQYVQQLMHVLEVDPGNYYFRFEQMTLALQQSEHARFLDLFDMMMSELKKAGEIFWLVELGNVCVALRLLVLALRVEDTLEQRMQGRTPDETWQLAFLKARIKLLENNIPVARLLLDSATTDANRAYPEILNLKAIIHKRCGELEEAATAVEQAIRSAPDDYRLRYNLALIQLDLGQITTAKDTLRGALALHPDYDRALRKLDELTRGE